MCALDIGRWRLIVIGAIAAVSSSIGGSEAADWFLGSTVTSSGVYDDNLSLQPKPAGDAWGLINGLSAELLAKNPTSQLGLTADLSYRDYWGKGAASNSFGGLHSTYGLSFDKRSKLTDINLNASLSQQNANSSELTDTGVVTTDVTRVAYNFDAGLEHRLNHRNTFDLSASADVVDFIGPTSALTPSRTVSTSASWHYKGTKRTEARTTLSTRWFVADNPSENESLTWTGTAGLQSQLTKRLTFDGEVGAILVRSSAIDPTVAAMGRETDVSLGYVADASLTYALKRTSLTFTASHDVSPGSLGDLQTRTSFGFQATHSINDLESLSLSTQYSELTQGASSGSSSAPARKFLTISPAYSYRLTRDLRADFVYKFVQIDNGFTTATSNSVMLTFSKDLVLLP